MWAVIFQQPWLSDPPETFHSYFNKLKSDQNGWGENREEAKQDECVIVEGKL